MVVYEQLRRKIIEGEFAPGEKLTMAKLKQSLKVGQCPIREALWRLTEAGLVTVDLNKGFRVSNLSDVDYRELIHALCLIESIALIESIKYGGEEWEGNIVSSLHHLSTTEKNHEEFDYFIWSERNKAFHLALVSGHNNSYLLRLRNLLFAKLERYTHVIMEVNSKNILVVNDEHKNIAEAALKRNVDEACHLLKKHYADPLELFIQELNRKLKIMHCRPC
jgi:GntR family transcriptional regulator, carbon starvation induced regulator